MSRARHPAQTVIYGLYALLVVGGQVGYYLRWGAPPSAWAAVVGACAALTFGVLAWFGGEPPRQGRFVLGGVVAVLVVAMAMRLVTP